MTRIEHDPNTGQWVLTCTDCPTISAADTRTEIENDQQAHDDWHANHR